ncbi:MAG: DUF2634 domain-containing protein [Bacillota bacterium]|nr:DUF2634 domain-containing protein [Bacillota bacterium]
MNSIFPFVAPQENIETDNELPLAQEWAWDFEKLDFKSRDGKMYLVEGAEAVKIWLWKLFHTPRYRYPIYSWDYGHELENLIGQGYTQGFLKSEAEKYVKEAVEYNLGGYVLEVRNFKLSFDEGTLTIEFTAITPYGEVDMRV